MELSLWALMLVICKLGIYLGFSAAVGGVNTVFIFGRNANSLRQSLNRYLWISIVVALLATGLAFVVQIGALAETGFGGMWNPLLRTILWGSAVGESTLWRGLGFALMLVAMAAFRAPKNFYGVGFLRLLAFTLWLVALYLLGFSFVNIGHTAELHLWTKLALSLHVVAIAWWMGTLWPLWFSCKKLDRGHLHSIMQRFGRLAQFNVALLITVGIFVATQLLNSVSALWLTEYGQILSAKLIVVTTILLLALYHKLRLVPGLLLQSEYPDRLARSIQIEMVLGFIILLTTAVLTTLVGPSHVA
jgi:putative copper resistance protein D